MKENKNKPKIDRSLTKLNQSLEGMHLIRKCPVPTSKLGKIKKSKKLAYDNSSNTQCRRFLAYFDNVSPRISTMKARELGIIHPAGRIKDLRNNGHRILTHWTYEPDANGVLHRVALYIYCGKREGSTYAA